MGVKFGKLKIRQCNLGRFPWLLSWGIPCQPGSSMSARESHASQGIPCQVGVHPLAWVLVPLLIKPPMLSWSRALMSSFDTDGHCKGILSHFQIPLLTCDFGN